MVLLFWLPTNVNVIKILKYPCSDGWAYKQQLRKFSYNSMISWSISTTKMRVFWNEISTLGLLVFIFVLIFQIYGLFAQSQYWRNIKPTFRRKVKNSQPKFCVLIEWKQTVLWRTTFTSPRSTAEYVDYSINNTDMAQVVEGHCYDDTLN